MPSRKIPSPAASIYLFLMYSTSTRPMDGFYYKQSIEIKLSHTQQQSMVSPDIKRVVKSHNITVAGTFMSYGFLGGSYIG